MTEALAILSRIERDLASLRALLGAPEERDPEPEEMLAPCQLADRLGIGEAYVRKLIGRGIAQELPGFERRGGRLFATADAVRALWG